MEQNTKDTIVGFVVIIVVAIVITFIISIVYTAYTQPVLNPELTDMVGFDVEARYEYCLEIKTHLNKGECELFALTTFYNERATLILLGKDE